MRQSQDETELEFSWCRLGCYKIKHKEKKTNEYELRIPIIIGTNLRITNWNKDTNYDPDNYRDECIVYASCRNCQLFLLLLIIPTSFCFLSCHPSLSRGNGGSCFGSSNHASGGVFRWRQCSHLHYSKNLLDQVVC